MSEASEPNSNLESSNAPHSDDYSLQEVEQHFTELVAGVEDHAIFLLDPNGIVKSWNAGARRIKGYEAERDHRTFVHAFLSAGCNRPRLAARRTEAAAEAGRFQDEGWRLRKDGSRIWANVVITALRTPARRASRLSENHAGSDRTQAGGRDFAAKRRATPPHDRERSGLCDFHARSGRASRHMELGCRANQGIHSHRKSSASISRSSIHRKMWPMASRSASSKQPSARVALKMKAGASARTGRNFGRM